MANHVAPRFGHLPIASITEAQVSAWAGGLVAAGLSGSTASRYLSTLRSILAFAVADGRVARNVAALVKPPKAGRARPEGQFLSLEELEALARACAGPYADVVRVVGLCGLRWGELAGLQVGDRVRAPGEGLRLQRSVLASSAKGGLYVDTLTGRRSPTVALPRGRRPDPRPLECRQGALSLDVQRTWWRSPLRVELEALRRVAWRVCGHRPADPARPRPTAYGGIDLARCGGHLIDRNLCEAAQKVGGTTGASEGSAGKGKAPDSDEKGA